jgi:hypothetical protein
MLRRLGAVFADEFLVLLFVYDALAMPGLHS